MKHAFLRVGPQQLVRIDADLPMRIGRDAKNCDVVLTSQGKVSRIHARIFTRDGHFHVEDAGSKIGTYVGEVRIAQPTRLEQGTVISIGGIEMEFLRDPPRSASRPTGVVTEVPPCTAGDDEPEDPSRRQAGQLSTLYRVSRKLSTIRALPVLLQDILNELFEVVPIDRGGIFLCQPDGSLELTVQRSDLTEEAQELKYSQTLLDHVIENRRAVLVPEVASTPSLSDVASVQDNSMKSVICVPLVAPSLGEDHESDQGPDQVVGVIQVHSATHRRPLDESDRALLSGIGSIAAVAILNARLFQQLNRRLHQIQFLHELELAIGDEREVGELLDQAVGRIAGVMNAESAGLLLHRAEGDPLRIAVGEPNAIPWDWMEQVLDQNPAEPVLMGRAVIAKLDPGSKNGGSRPVGALGVMRRSASSTSTDRLLLEIFASQVGSVLQRKSYFDERQATKRLATLGQFASSLIHDLRNPLSTASGFASLLPLMDGERREFFSAKILSCLQRCDNMAREILDFSRGQSRLTLESVSSEALLDEVRELISPAMEDHGIAVQMENGWPEDIVVDRERMLRVLLNLASNARIAMASGGTFRISLNKGEGHYEFLVEDSGPGIPAEHRDRLFEPFVTHGNADGTGLGLAICRELVFAHDGSIRVDPVCTTGARFILRIADDLVPGKRTVEFSHGT